MQKILFIMIISSGLFAHETIKEVANYAYFWPIIITFSFMAILLWKNKQDLQDYIKLLQDKQTQLDRVQQDFVNSQKIAAIGLLSMDRKDDTISLSEGAHLILETDEKTFDNTFASFLKLVHPSDLYIIDSAYNDEPIINKTYTMEFRIITPSGNTKYVEVRYEHKLDEKGNFIESRGFISDISAQRKLEEKLLDSNFSLEHKVQERTKEQQVLLSLFDKGESAMFKWNNDTKWSIDYVSESVQHVLGYDKEMFLTHQITYAECVHPEDLPRVIDEVTAASEDHLEYFEHEPYRIITADDEIKWVHDATVIVYNELDDITHFVGYIADITHIRERDRQLMMQSRMAQMGEMISMIAHQWRQPLAAISATTMNLKIQLEMQGCSSHSPSGKQCMDDINHEVDHIDSYVKNLTETIDDFRNFYKPDKKPQHMKLSQCVEAALDIVREPYKSNGIEIIEHYEDETEVSVLKNEMMQVILNILKNAQDNFKEKNTQNPTLTIVSRTEEYAAILEIYDNGGGIKESMVDKIFDPYFTTKETKNGTGIGLYMSKTIIEKHHKGKLSARNIDGGVCFSVVLDLPMRLENAEKEEELTLV